MSVLLSAYTTEGLYFIVCIWVSSYPHQRVPLRWECVLLGKFTQDYEVFFRSLICFTWSGIKFINLWMSFKQVKRIILWLYFDFCYVSPHPEAQSGFSTSHARELYYPKFFSKIIFIIHIVKDNKWPIFEVLDKQEDSINTCKFIRFVIFTTQLHKIGSHLNALC